VSEIIYRYSVAHGPQRRRLALDISDLGVHSTDLQRAKILERSNALQHKFDSWTETQQLYIPSVATVRSKDTSSTPWAVQDLALYLPSALVDTINCDARLNWVEWLM